MAPHPESNKPLFLLFMQNKTMKVSKPNNVRLPVKLMSRIEPVNSDLQEGDAGDGAEHL